MKIEVVAFPRTQQGTGASRRLRRTERVPGIIYGAGKPAVPIELDGAPLLRYLNREAFHASVLDLTVDGVKERVLLRDFQMHPWRPFALHVDFQRVDPKKKIHMRVPLHFVNADIAPGVKIGGGIVQHVYNDLEITCLPDDLPEFIEVDLKSLELGDALHINDLVLPKGVEPLGKQKQENPAVAILQVPKMSKADEEADKAPTTEITGQGPAEVAAAAAAKKEDKK